MGTLNLQFFFKQQGQLLFYEFFFVEIQIYLTCYSIVAGICWVVIETNHPEADVFELDILLCP